MKFSFDSEGYRNNLANELREQRTTDKEDARQRLEEERATLKYRVSEDIKKVKQKIKEKREEKGLEPLPFTPNPEKITTEEVRLEGSDGIEHLLEVQTMDISDQIPDELKLVYDAYRLCVLNFSLNHTNIASNIFDEFEAVRQGHDGGFYDILENLLMEDEVSPELLQYYSIAKSPKEDRDLFLGEYSDLNKEEAEKRRQIYKSNGEEYHALFKDFDDAFKNFYEAVTNGAISDKNFFAHVVGAHREGYSFKLKDRYPERHRNLQQQSPHESDEEIVREKPIDLRGAASEYLWVNAGGTFYDRIQKPVILIDSRSKRFKDEIAGYDFYEGRRDEFNEYLEKIIEDNTQDLDKNTLELMAALEKARQKNQGGVKIIFKRNEPWLLIADQIVDPYHGRIIKVREKIPTEDIVPVPSPE